jgi:hypothetical protein
MNPELQNAIQKVANLHGVSVAKGFYTKLDNYCAKYFNESSKGDKDVIQTYLAQTGLKIAKTEQKKTLEAEDAKAAIYYLHMPTSLTDKCEEAGQFILKRTRRRSVSNDPLLSDALRKYLTKK